MKPILIGLAGRAGSGKDTVGKMIWDSLPKPVRLMSFANPMKTLCQEVFAFTDEQLHGPSEERNKPDLRYPRPDGTYLTPREALQKLGTEFGRACYPNIWTEMSFREWGPHLPSTIFTDVRFLNEAKSIRDRGGFVWRIYRPEADSVIAVHQSEVELDSAEMKSMVTHEIFNIDSLEKLRIEVHATLQRTQSHVQS